MTFDGIDIPESLRPVEESVDPALAARRAEVLLGQIQSAKERGLLTRDRASRALGELNKMLMDIGMQFEQARISTLRIVPHADGSAHIISPVGTSEQVSTYSKLERAYRTLLDSMNLIEKLAEGIA